MSPIVAAQVRFIRANMKLGWSQQKIGDMLGVSQSHVSKLKRLHIDGAGRSLYDRWLNVHDIRSIGERAVEETR